MEHCEAAMITMLRGAPNFAMLWLELKHQLVAAGFEEADVVDASINLEDKTMINEIQLFCHDTGYMEMGFKLNEIIPMFDLIDNDNCNE